MNGRKWAVWMLVLLSSLIGMADAPGKRVQASVQNQSDQTNSSKTELITAEELKAKVGRNESVTIIDVRDTKSYVGSSTEIKGAIHVKLRRLRYRLSFAPLKNVPRESEVVTYCACPNDEASISAAQILSDAGFKHVRVLKGGWRMWLKVNGQVESRP